MKKFINGFILLGLIVTLSGCDFLFDSEMIDFENCLNDECTETETEEALVEYLDYVFEEPYRDLLYDDDVEVVTNIEVTDDEYTITLLYTQDSFSVYYTAVTQTLDLLYTVEIIEEELKLLDTDKAYTIIASWKDATLEDYVEMKVIKEQGAMAKLHAVITDLSMSYDIVLNELLGFLGSYELVTENWPISSYISITTDVGEFTVYTEYNSFVHEIGYIAIESVLDSESKLDELEGIVLNEKRSGYAVVVK